MKVKIKLLILVALILPMVISVAGCEFWEMSCKDFESDTSGLSRTVTLYSVDGSIIKTYEFTGTIDTTDGVASFNDDSGKRIIFNGTYLIEEK